MNEVLQQVKNFAGQAHGEQQRKFVAELYINHPVRVMELCSTVTQSLPVLSAALLHDVLEDTPVRKEELLNFLSTVMELSTAKRTLDLVVELTDLYTKANYPDLNRKKRKAREKERLSKTSADAQTIKYADIIDNSRDIGGEPDFAPVFLRESAQLLAAMEKGHEGLRQQAIAAVEQSLQQLQQQS